VSEPPNKRPTGPGVPPTLKDWRQAELEKLDSLGGPVDLTGLAPLSWRQLRSINLSLDDLLPALAEFSLGGESWASRHWPWVAIACHRWRIRNEIMARRGPISLKPSDIKAGLGRIANHAEKIIKELEALSRASHSFTKHERNKSGHVSWLLNYLYLNQEYDIRLDDFRTAEFTGDMAVAAVNSQRELEQRLVRLAVTANALCDFARADLLTVRNPPGDPGLADFVGTLALVWSSLTGRVPSVNKVPSRPEDDRPDFVRFIQKVADVQVRASATSRPWAALEIEPFDMVAPTYSTIATAFQSTPSSVGD
jgi:hypothetical protein